MKNYLKSIKILAFAIILNSACVMVTHATPDIAITDNRGNTFSSAQVIEQFTLGNFPAQNDPPPQLTQVGDGNFLVYQTKGVLAEKPGIPTRWAPRDI